MTMKKKMFAAMTAGALLCGMLTAPVSAAETFQMGDVNMDGVVDVKDAQLILYDFAGLLNLDEGILTSQQRELGNVDGIIETDKKYGFDYVASVADAQFVLVYYSTHLVNPEITLDAVVGKELSVSEALTEFNNQFKIVWDEETEKFISVERY